jgi:hypothetical protein
VITVLASKPASDVTVAQDTMGGEWTRASAGYAGRRPNVGRKGTNDEGHPKEGDKRDDEAQDRDT